METIDLTICLIEQNQPPSEEWPGTGPLQNTLLRSAFSGLNLAPPEINFSSQLKQPGRPTQRPPSGEKKVPLYIRRPSTPKKKWPAIVIKHPTKRPN